LVNTIWILTGKHFILKNKQTACLAQDACGILSKNKRKIIRLNNACCTPNSMLKYLNNGIRPITKDNFSEVVEIYKQGLTTNIPLFKMIYHNGKIETKDILTFAGLAFMKIIKCLVGRL
jgi:hypothetical protein